MTSPLVSVVIPTYNRPDLLGRCLDGLARMTFERGGFEVIVVDDGSPVPVEETLLAFRDRLSLHHVRQERGGPGAARNAGVAIAAGRYAAFIDDDCVPAVDWLSCLVTELEKVPHRMVGGRVKNSLSHNRYADASDRIARFVYDYYGNGPANEPFFTTNNLAVGIEEFRELGGFTTSIPSATAEDKEFCDRWRSHGWPLVQVPQAVVHHAHDLTFTRFVRQHFQYGRGILSFRLLRRERATSPLLPEPVGFYAALLASPLRNGGGRRASAVALVAVAQLATAAGALREAIDQRPFRRNGRHPSAK